MGQGRAVDDVDTQEKLGQGIAPCVVSAMGTRITSSNFPALGIVSGSEEEDGAAQTGVGAAPVCEGSEGTALPGANPRARQENGKYGEVVIWKTYLRVACKGRGWFWSSVVGCGVDQSFPNTPGITWG